MDAEIKYLFCWLGNYTHVLIVFSFLRFLLLFDRGAHTLPPAAVERCYSIITATITTSTAPLGAALSSQPAPATRFVILSTASFLIKLCHFTVGVKKRNGLVLSNYRHSYFRRPGCLLRLLLPLPPPPPSSDNVPSRVWRPFWLGSALGSHAPTFYPC